MAVEARKALVASICKLLSLLAVETNNAGVFSKGSAAAAKRNLVAQKVIAERHAWVHSFVDCIISVLQIGAQDAAHIRSMVETACEDNVVVTQAAGPKQTEEDEEEEEFVVVRTLQSVIAELVGDLQQSTANKEAWLELVFKVLVREQADQRRYDARARASLKRLVRSLGVISWKKVAAIESKTAEAQLRLIEDEGGALVPMNGTTTGTGGRYVKVALAALGGGALLMYTGSMAAPSIAASLVALCTAGGTFTGINASTAALFSYIGLTSTSAISTVFGATGAGLTGYKMSRRTMGVTDFHFVPLHSPNAPATEDDDDPSSSSTSSEAGSNTGLPVFICVSGWVDEGQDPRQLWGGTGGCLDGKVTTLDDEEEEGEGGEEVSVATTTTTSGSEEGGVEETSGVEFQDVMLLEDTVEAAAAADQCNNNHAAAASPPSMVTTTTTSPAAAAMTDGNASSSSPMMESWQVMKKASTGWWRDYVPGGEEHVLIWESDVLAELHKGMREFVWNEASRFAIDEMIKHTALAGLTSAAALPMNILDAASKLDNPWALAMDRAKEAGQILANVLASRPQGSRPVTLVGYSMGARVIFHCLEALYSKGQVGHGIVENAVLLGTPIGRSVERWRKVRSIVAGRLINGYSTRDWVLMFLFRSKTWELGVAGLSPIDGGFVENVDLTDLVPGHLSLASALPAIMAQLKLEE